MAVRPAPGGRDDAENQKEAGEIYTATSRPEAETVRAQLADLEPAAAGVDG